MGLLWSSSAAKSPLQLSDQMRSKRRISSGYQEVRRELSTLLFPVPFISLRLTLPHKGLLHNPLMIITILTYRFGSLHKMEHDGQDCG